MRLDSIHRVHDHRHAMRCELSTRERASWRQPSSATSALQRALDDTLRVEGLNELPGAFICPPTTAQTMELTSTLPTKTHGNLQAVLSTDGESISFTRVDTGAKYFEARPVLESLPRGDDTSLDGYLQAVLTLAAGDASERLYGLGQGEWNKPPGAYPFGPSACRPAGTQWPDHQPAADKIPHCRTDHRVQRRWLRLRLQHAWLRQRLARPPRDGRPPSGTQPQPSPSIFG